MKLASLLKKLESGSHAAHHALSNPPPTQSATDQQSHFVFHLFIFTSFSGFGRNFTLLASVACLVTSKTKTTLKCLQ